MDVHIPKDTVISGFAHRADDTRGRRIVTVGCPHRQTVLGGYPVELLHEVPFAAVCAAAVDGGVERIDGLVERHELFSFGIGRKLATNQPGASPSYVAPLRRMT